MVKRTFLDRFVGAISPQAELRRHTARLRTETMLKRYDEWSTNLPHVGSPRSTGDPNGSSPNSRHLRRRVRELAVTNATVAMILEEWETHAAPIACRAMYDVEDRALRLKLNSIADTAWYEWGLKADYQGLTDFDGLQRMVVRALRQDGMILVRRRNVPTEMGIRPSFQIQLIEVDYLDETRDRFDTSTGVTITRGIQFDRDGRRMGAWLHTQHPTAMGFVAGTSVFVPSSELLFIFDPERPGQQVGGVPMGTVVDHAEAIDLMVEARLERAKIENCMVGSVTDPNADVDPVGVPTPGGTAINDGKTIAPYVVDSWGRPVEEFHPGMMMYGPPGRQVTFHQPSGTGGFAEFVSSQDRKVTVGGGVPYEKATGDYSGVNFSSSRMSEGSFKRRVRKHQDKVLLPQFLRPVFHDWFVPAALSWNMIAQGKLWSKWTPPSWDSVQPLDDANANLIKMRSCEKTPQQVCAENGLDFEDQVAEFAEAFRMFDAAGAIFDSDPRKRTKSGNPADPADLAAAKGPQENTPPQGEADRERAESVSYLRKVQ